MTVLSRRRFFAHSTAAVAGALGLVACTVPLPTASTATSAAVSAPRQGGVLRISKPDDILLAGAPHALLPPNLQLLPLLYETLVRYDHNLNPQPRLATRWEWSNDFRLLTLQLRNDVRFHTGRPFTSEDAKFNLERLRDPAVGSQWLNYSKLMTISAPAPDVLTIAYDAPVKSSFDALASTYIADPLTLDNTVAGRDFVGTGPFRFKEWATYHHFSVLRNSDYWQPGKPHVEQIDLQIIPDSNTAVVALQTEAVDWCTAVPPKDVVRFQSDPGYQSLLTANGGQFYYVGIDLSVPQLSDKRVRQAFGYALNRPGMVNTALSGLGRPASVPWPRQSLAYDATQDTTYSYDLPRARQLLEAAGWDPNYTLSVSIPSSLALAEPMAQILQGDLGSIGVRTDIRKIPFPDFITMAVKGGYGGVWIVSMALMNLSPATFLRTSLAVRVPNASYFSTPRYLQLMDETAAATDDQQLKAGLHEMTQIILDEAFVLPIAEGFGQQTGAEVARSKVKNINWDAIGFMAFEDVWLDA
jgi:peptide/nickel transport system substrate-binding protein